MSRKKSKERRKKRFLKLCSKRKACDRSDNLQADKMQVIHERKKMEDVK